MRNAAMISLSCLLLAMLCGCPPQVESGNGNNTGNNAPAPAANVGGTVRLPLEISADDPALLAMDFTDQRMYALARAVGAPLFQPGNDGDSVQPGIAIQTEKDDSGSSWKFTLPAAAGSDADAQSLGRKLHSRFISYVNGARTPLRATILDLVEGADKVVSGDLEISGIAVADNEISFTLTRPYMQFDLWLSQPGLYLADVEVLEDESGISGCSSSGYGIWRIDRFEASEEGVSEIVLLPNPDSLLGKPAAEELRFILEPDRAAQVELFRAGGLDAAGIPVDEVQNISEDQALSGSLSQHDSAAVLLVLFDHGQSPWGDQKMQDKVGLRKSMALCISRETLEKENADQVHGWGHFLPDHFRDSIPMELLNNPTFPRAARLEEARAMQKQSDHEQGSHLPPGLDVSYLEFDNLQGLTRNLRHYWRDISVNLQPHELSATDMLRRISLNSHELIVFWNFPAWPSPDACIYPQLYGALIDEGANYSRIDNRAINGLIEQAQATADDRQRRLYFQQINGIIEDQGLFVPAAYASPSLLLRPGLSVTPNAYDFNASLQGQDFGRIGFAE